MTTEDPSPSLAISAHGMWMRGCPLCGGVHRYYPGTFPEGTLFLIRCPSTEKFYSFGLMLN